MLAELDTIIDTIAIVIIGYIAFFLIFTAVYHSNSPTKHSICSYNYNIDLLHIEEN